MAADQSSDLLHCVSIQGFDLDAGKCEMVRDRTAPEPEAPPHADESFLPRQLIQDMLARILVIETVVS